MAAGDVIAALALGVPFAGFALGGLVVGYKTYTARQAAQSLRAMPTTDVAALAPGNGPAKVEGTAHAVDDLLSASLLTATGVARKTRIWTDGEHQRYDWVDTETAVPFLVDDGTGEVRVDFPEAGAVDVETDRYNRKRDDDHSTTEIPERAVRQWADGFDDFHREDWNDESFPADHVKHLIATEGVVDEREEVIVVGEPTTDDSGDLVLAGGSQPAAFRVASVPESELDSSLWESGVGYVVGGLMFVVGAAPFGLIVAGLVT